MRWRMRPVLRSQGRHGRLFCVGLVLAFGEDGAVCQSLVFLSIAALTAALNCRLASAAAWPRTDPATRFAALNHMLMNGFFFSHGLLISVLVDGDSVGPSSAPYGGKSFAAVVHRLTATSVEGSTVLAIPRCAGSRRNVPHAISASSATWSGRRSAKATVLTRSSRFRADIRAETACGRFIEQPAPGRPSSSTLVHRLAPESRLAWTSDVPAVPNRTR